MRKHAVVLTLTSLELLALVLLAFFWKVMRVDLALTYGLTLSAGRSETLPLATYLALAPSAAPLIGACGALLFAIAWLQRRGTNVRNWWLGAALVWTVLGLGWIVWAAYAPAFERLA